MLRCFAFVVVCAVFSSASVVSATDAKPRPLSKSEAEIISLNEELYAAYDRLHMRADKITEVAEQEKFYAENDPTPKFVDRLIEFERSHHGTHAGLMAVRKLIHLGGGGGEFENARDVGRRQTLQVLKDYGQTREFPEIIRSLDTGNFEPQVEVTLNQIIKDPQVSEENRMYASFVLARLSLKLRNWQQSWERRLKELQNGSDVSYPREKESLLSWKALAKSENKLDEVEQEAIQILETLSSSNSEMRQPGVTNIDDNWLIIEFDSEKTKSKPTLKEMAAGLLFKERHLKEGQPAPDLKLKLVSGENWSLADQLGKTVIIQFSFKGYGPCEAMYPDLRELAAKHNEKLTILSIMADEKQEDTTDAVKSGKITWNVYWDDFGGPVATQWAVTGFPTVYVIGPDGKIVTYRLRGEKLKAKIAELTRC